MLDACESQVRLMAGIVVTAGLILGIFWNQWALVVPAFAGLNLFQSSITGVCPAEWFLPGCSE
ncbi:DUF2892 domain-containing protein [Salinarchaeum sp. IM2453]|uniref:YgaP family membrane protein n=1 Tax=Salinarchaeum sp. IM2453 TaxID=2862870 RepID=UPI00210859E8|nr:DUF2892 domain-containing protein [Salinarchaeum sp. IM2453]